jgi:hypothetical protein
VLEYIWKAAWCLHPAGDAAAEDWVAVRALAVLAGDSARAGGNHRTDARYPGRRGPGRARRRASRAHIITTSLGADSR